MGTRSHEGDILSTEETMLAAEKLLRKKFKEVGEVYFDSNNIDRYSIGFGGLVIASRREARCPTAIKVINGTSEAGLTRMLKALTLPLSGCATQTQTYTS